MKRGEKYRNRSEKIGLYFVLFCLIWLMDNTTSILSSQFSIGRILKSDWTRNIEILLAIIGILFGMEMRNGKIKPLIGFIICPIILLLGILVRFSFVNY